MVEIEIRVLASQCFDRRIDRYTRSSPKLPPARERRNAECARVNWRFTTEKVSAELRRAQPKPIADHV